MNNAFVTGKERAIVHEVELRGVNPYRLLGIFRQYS